MKGKSVIIPGLLILSILGIFSAKRTEAVVAPDTIPIQGKLTDPGGIPLSGTFDITFSLYDVEAGGVALCTDTRTVNVVGGLFSDYMEGCMTSFLGQLVYLGIKVGTDDEMLPRQVIRPVPYALNLRPRSTYIFVPGSAVVPEKNTDGMLWDISRNGNMQVKSFNAPAEFNVMLPIPLPAYLHGQAQRISNVRIYYKCSPLAPNFITQTTLYKQTDVDSYLPLKIDDTDRKIDVATSYILDDLGPDNVLQVNEGIIGLNLRLHFETNNADPIVIGGVRVGIVDNY